jgi:hypothetical protein
VSHSIENRFRNGGGHDTARMIWTQEDSGRNAIREPEKILILSNGRANSATRRRAIFDET